MRFYPYRGWSDAMKKIEQVAIIGLGALGVMYAQRFAQSIGYQNVVFLGDATRINRLYDDGIYCNHEKIDVRMINPERENFKADLILFATKYGALNEAIQLAQKVVTHETVILSVLNGITSEVIIEDKLHAGNVIKCVAQGMDALKIANQMTYTNFGEICLGITDEEKEKQESLDRVIDFFKYTHCPYTIESDINFRLWGKWMLNIGVNQVVMIYEGSYGTLQKPGEARDLMKAAMQEVISIAQTSNINLNQDHLEKYVLLMDTLNPQSMPSMRQDGLAKRLSEVELFSGTLIQKAKHLKMSVPVNEYLYKTIKDIESKY